MQSKYAGFCKVDKSHMWAAGDEIFYQADPKCICSNKACFESQKSPQKKIDITSNHTERTLDAAILKSNLAWDYAVEKANRVLPPTNGFNKDNSILSQVFYKGIIELLK